MKLYEYQAKELLVKNNISTPPGGVAESADQAAEIAATTGLPVAIKAQVHVGGRGKAGGIKIAKTEAEVKILAAQILAMKIKGLSVKKVLIEKALEIEKEYYLGIVVDRANRGNTLMFSTVGGVDIEEVARTRPDKIFKFEILNPKQIQNHNFQIPVGNREVHSQVSAIIEKLYDLYLKTDATLVEINPLVKTKDRQFIAADAKIIIDDSALFRHPDLALLAEAAEEDEIEAEAHRRRIAYVRLPGNIGIIGNGAGLVMTTMDEVKRAGGQPASFLDIGGGAKAELVKSCLEILTMDKNIKGIFFNVFGGITRCDEVAQGIIRATQDLNLKIPLVIRLTGTREEEGQKILAQTNLVTAATMQEGAEKIVEHISK